MTKVVSWYSHEEADEGEESAGQNQVPKSDHMLKFGYFSQKKRPKMASWRLLHIAVTESGLCWWSEVHLLALPEQAVISSFRAGVSPVHVTWLSRRNLICSFFHGLELVEVLWL